MNRLIAVVDDEPDILALVRLHLEKAGFRVETFEQAEPFLEFINTALPQLVVLDLMLPDADGLEICKYLKGKERFSGVSIIMLTAKGEETDKILGLELGADDYVTKPFSPRELVARVKAVLRRDREPSDPGSVLQIGGILSIDPGKHQVLLMNLSIDLTTTEFRILHLLARHPGWVFTRTQIVDAVRGDYYPVTDRSVDVQIVGLRKKLGSWGRYIETVRGVVYRLKE